MVVRVDLGGDHHVHSTFSDDATSSLQQNLDAAAAAGLHTLCATEHVRSTTGWVPEFLDAVAALSPAAGPDGTPVALWVDSFTDHFAPQVAHAAARVLEAAGYRVHVPGADTCCGLTWITTGQLDRARTILGGTVESLVGAADAGWPIVGVEPSCTAVLRGEALDLVSGEAAIRSSSRFTAVICGGLWLR